MPPTTFGSSAGYWGNPTSTLDWCESNYVACFWIAEFWNTVSNLLIFLPAVYGMYRSYRHGSDWDLIGAYFGLSTVGFGSWMFHMTLKWEMQLLDELPMIYCGCMLVWCSLDPKYHRAGWTGVAAGAFLICYSVAVTVVYLESKNPVFHQTMYGLLVTWLVYRSVKIQQTSEGTVMRELVSWGLTSYFTGVVLWIIDNLCCVQLQGLRSSLPQIFQPLTELHAWWHIGVGIGSYYYIVFLSVAKAKLFQKIPHHVTYHYGFPVLNHEGDVRKHT